MTVHGSARLLLLNGVIKLFYNIRVCKFQGYRYKNINLTLSLNKTIVIIKIV